MSIRLLAALAFLGLGWWHVSAQDAVPAQPVSPAPAVPAQPVGSTAQPATPVGVPATPAGGTPAAPDATSAPAPQVRVLADSSLRDVLQELAQTWADDQPSNPQMPLTLTNAGTMRTQLDANPTWDVVISPDLDELKSLTDKGVILAQGQHTVARNSLVIYGRKALVKDDDLDWFDLVGTQWKKVAMGNPDLAYSGRVAQRALQKHDLDDDDHRKMYVNAGTETLALAVAERDQADAVFLYRSDLPNAHLPGFDVFPLSTDDAPPVFYGVAVGRLAKNPAGAQAFIDYISGVLARPIWAKYGFETN